MMNHIPTYGINVFATCHNARGRDGTVKGATIFFHSLMDVFSAAATFEGAVAFAACLGASAWF